MSRRLLAALLALAAASGAARAEDRVELSSGKIVAGVIESESDAEIVMRVGSESFLTIPKRVVARVERGAPPKREEPPAPATRPADAAAPAQRPAPAGADAALLAAFAGPVREEAAKAAARIVLEWPASGATLMAALAHASPAVRREAVLLLDRANLAGSSSLITGACRDADASVRVLAVRALRGRAVPGAEALLLGLLASDAAPAVRFETLRTLEEVGTAACLEAVLVSLERERDAEPRRRHLRVLKKLTGEDHGDDLRAWREAAVRARARVAREPK